MATWASRERHAPVALFVGAAHSAISSCCNGLSESSQPAHNKCSGSVAD